MNLTKKAALYGTATLAALGLAAGQMAAAVPTDTISSFDSVQGPNGPNHQNVAGHFSDTENSSNVTVGGTSVSISPLNNPADPNGSTGSARLFSDGATASAQALDFLGAPGIPQSSLYTVNVNYATDPGLVSTVHLYFSTGTSDPYSASIWTALPAGTGSGNWTDFTSDANTIWTEHSAGPAYSFSGTGTLASVLGDLNNLGTTSAFALSGIGVDNQNNTGDAWFSSIQIRDRSGAITQNVNFATPEPASWAAFAFMGLGAAALVFKARKRKALVA